MDTRDAFRTHTMYFRINQQDPFAVRNLSTTEYVLLKNHDDAAFQHVLKLCDEGKIVNTDPEITSLFRSIDDVDYTLIATANDESVDPQPGYESNEQRQEVVTETDNLQVNVEDDVQPTEGPTSISGLSKKTPQSKPSSAAWKYFEKEKNGTARCNICNKIYKHGGNTTNLLQHLNTSHALFCSEIIKKRQKTSATSASSDDSIDEPPPIKRVKVKSQLTRIDEAFERTNSFLEGGNAADKITTSILYMISVDKMPLSTVQNEGFKQLMKTVAPLYTVPSRKTITKLLNNRYEVLKEQFVMTLNDAATYSLTCDNWTDVTNESYLGVTIHYVTKDTNMKKGCIGVYPLSQSHTSKYLPECLNSVIEDFNLEKSKISAVITDSAANIKKAIRDFMGPEKHLSCFAHTLSHLVPDVLSAMPTVRDIITKVKMIVTMTRRSIAACDELRKLQIRDGKTEGTTLKFIQDVPTRWNSTLHMLERFLALEDYVYAAISKCPTAPDMLKRDEVQILHDIVSLIKPVECVITEVSGESYPTCSIIIPLVHCLRAAIQECKLVTKCGIDFKDKLETGMDRRFKDFELNKILAISNILDPRFKKLHFQSALAASSAMSRINDNIKKDTPQKSSQPLSKESTKKPGLWSFHDRLVESKADNNAHSEDVSFELRQYLSQPVIPRSEDPLKYWSSMKLGFPSLHKLALKYISIVGTSVPCERLFSQAGDIKTDNRSRLTGEHLNKLLFLSSLARKDWGFV